MRNADISYLCTYLCPNWLPRTAWSFNAIMSGLGSEHTLRLPLEFENDRHPIPDLAHFFHKNISHTTKLPHHHAQLPCTLCKPVVWGQSHGSRASSPVPSQRALNRNPAQNHNALPTAGLRPSKKMILVVCTPYFIVVECCCHMPHVAMHWTNQKFWPSYAQSMCANSGAFCFQSVLFVGSLTITQHRSLFKLYTGWWPGWHVCPRETAWLRTG